MLNLQSNTQDGRKVFLTAASLAGLEGLLVKLVNSSGAPQVALPAALADRCPYIIHDGGFSASGSVNGPAASVWPLEPGRNVQLWLNGSCNPGDVLCLANPAAAITTITTSNGGSFSVAAGMVSVLPAPGSGLALGGITLSSNKITAVAVSAGGTGYTNGQLVAFTDSTGYGAAGHLVVSAGVVASVAIDDGGAGYTTPAAVVAPPGVQYRVIGLAEEAGLSGQLVLVRYLPELAVV
jgi:hypothetical protein